jgi:hypothetical protein
LSLKQNSGTLAVAVEATDAEGGGSSRSRRHRRLLKWGLIFCFWTTLGLLYTGQLYVGTLMKGMNHSFWRLPAWQLFGCWYGWIAFTPLILWLGRRSPI